MNIDKGTYEITKSEQEWQEKLSPEEYYVHKKAQNVIHRRIQIHEKAPTTVEPVMHRYLRPILNSIHTAWPRLMQA